MCGSASMHWLFVAGKGYRLFLATCYSSSKLRESHTRSYEYALFRYSSRSSIAQNFNSLARRLHLSLVKVVILVGVGRIVHPYLRTLLNRLLNRKSRKYQRAYGTLTKVFISSMCFEPHWTAFSYIRYQVCDARGVNAWLATQPWLPVFLVFITRDAYLCYYSWKRKV